MLENIHIQNFRAFENFKAEGFERINLIGGKNNSGKSCLLEGILTCFIKDYIGNGIPNLRKENFEDLFYNKDKKPLLKFEIKFNSNIFTKEFEKNDAIFFTKVKNSQEQPAYHNVNYINQDITLPEINQINTFDTIQINKLDTDFSELLKIVDSRIENLRSYSSKGNKLFVQSKNTIDKPISSYGDAVKNIVNYFIPIFEKKALKINKLNILLIDEIENGLHYTAHYDFWKKLFQLSKSENVQVFSTTHSLEMIQAFNKVAKEEGEGAYFEMGREFETGKIYISKHEIDQLEYELERPNSTFRGE